MKEDKKEITIQEKKEVQTQSEATIPGKMYIPTTDILETENELMIYMDMPGVQKENLKVRVEKNILAIEGKIEASPYKGLKPIYTEYNVGNFARRFELSNEIDQSAINASMKDGVLQLVLPKIPERQPKLIPVT